MKKDEFLKAIDTLKLYRRAELMDEAGRGLISSLYVDPLPNDTVLKTILKPNTTFLIGRKGTGKSTIFQRAQEELNKNSTSTWAYIDIKTLYESSVADLIGNSYENTESSLSAESIRRIYTFKVFVTELVKEIKSQIKSRISSSLWNQVKAAFTGSHPELFEKLDEFILDLQENKYLDVTGTIHETRQNIDIEKGAEKVEAEASSKLSSTPRDRKSVV